MIQRIACRIVARVGYDRTGIGLFAIMAACVGATIFLHSMAAEIGMIVCGLMAFPLRSCRGRDAG